MALNKSNGNMYEFIDKTWNPIKGTCIHDCKYCYMKSIEKQEHLKLQRERFTNLDKNKFIFVEDRADLFAKDIPKEWILEILDHCDKYNNIYLFQSKNPERIMEFIDHPVFSKSVVCTTLETNREYIEMGTAPNIHERVLAMRKITSSRFIEAHVTIEPIMDFDLNEFVELIKECNPSQVNIGADSKNHNLPEPSKDKILELHDRLSKFTKVHWKSNIDRLLN